MSRHLTASDRSALIRLASTMPVGSPERRTVLTALSKTTLQRTASEADALLDQLADLAALDGTLTDIEESFASHYGRVASTDLYNEVKSHTDMLEKSKQGLKSANGILRLAEEVATSLPEDRTAKRAVTNAKSMIVQFEKHIKSAEKILRTLAQKQMPPALKDTAAKVKAALSKKLVNPTAMTVNPVLHSSFIYVEGKRFETVEFGYVFLIGGLSKHYTDKLPPWNIEGTGDKQSLKLELSEKPIGDAGVTFRGGTLKEPDDVADYMVNLLPEWPGLVGNDDRLKRFPIEVRQTLDEVFARLEGGRAYPVKMRGNHVMASYRLTQVVDADKRAKEYADTVRKSLERIYAKRMEKAAWNSYWIEINVYTTQEGVDWYVHADLTINERDPTKPFLAYT